MVKKHKEWIEKKIETDEVSIFPFFHKREIWWVRIGENIGFEQNGKGANFLRPVLVFKKFNKSLFWGIPLSKTEKSGIFYFKFNSSEKHESTLILSQLRLFDAKRLHDRFGIMGKEDFQKVEKAIQRILDNF